MMNTARSSIDRSCSDMVGPLTPRSLMTTPSELRGGSFWASSSCCSRCFCSFESFRGTSTSVVTSRSPAPPVVVGAPLPLMRNVVPLGVPAGTLSVTGPFSVGTCTFAPSAASGNEIGQREREVVALAAEQVVASDPHAHEQVTRVTAGRSRLAPARKLDTGAGLHSRRDPHLEGAGSPDRPGALARGARRLDDPPGGPASPARLRDREEPLIRPRSLRSRRIRGT